MEHANQGAKALASSDAATAVDAYTKALIEHPASPDYFTQRSIAFTRVKPPRYDLALQDADFGVLSGQKRGKRDKIQAAQQRRVVCLYNLGRYADAKLVLDKMKRWRPTNSKPQEMEHNMWEAKINGKLKITPQDATVSEDPEGPLPDDKTMRTLLQQQLKEDGTFNYGRYDRPDVSIDAVNASAAVPTTRATSTTANHTSQPLSTAPPPKIRHEWYQNNQNVLITIYAKGVAKDKIEVDLEEDSLSVSFPHPSDPSSSFTFNLDPLFALIDPSKSKYQVMSTKVELTLAKAAPGHKWANIEGTTPLKKATNGTAQHDPAKAAVLSTLQSQSKAVETQTAAAPSYPTSSRTGPKNWDKLASDLTAKKPKSKVKGKAKDTDKQAGSDSEDDADEDYDSDVGGDAVDGFFKKLYAGADPDTRRAMMKSFTESNGTSLSTNWNEVGSKRVEEVKSKSDD